jgi:hypothetical protein
LHHLKLCMEESAGHICFGTRLERVSSFDRIA